MKSTTLLSIIYALLTAFVLNSILNKEPNYHLVGIILSSVTLLVTYLVFIKKEDVKYGYILMLLFTGIGKMLFVYVNDWFYISILFYSLAHIIFIVIIYKGYLKHQSAFDIFTFFLPFIFIFLVAYILFDIPANEGFKIILTGVISCINATLVLLNYANTRSVQNYLFFIGIFIWLLVDAFAAMYMYKYKEDIFYLLTVMLDAIAQYMICRAFILDAIDEEDFLNKF